MKLCYRGVKYDYTPQSVDLVEDGDLVGRYRGCPLMIHRAHAAFHAHWKAIYRGVSYQY
jgi:hypothetical protein